MSAGPLTGEFAAVNAQLETTLNNASACSADTECHSVAVGAKACGGPTGYRAYSSKTVSTASVEALASVKEIPYGEPRSYERLAGELSAFDCGHAMGSNPVAVLVPCHRVTRGSMRPAAYVGGPQRLALICALETS